MTAFFCILTAPNDAKKWGNFWGEFFFIVTYTFPCKKQESTARIKECGKKFWIMAFISIRAGSFLFYTIHEMFGTSMWSTAMLYVLILWLYSVLLIFGARHLNITSDGAVKTVSAFSGIAVLTSIIYNGWMTEAKARRRAGLEQFREIVLTSDSAMDDMIGLLKNGDTLPEATEDLKKVVTLNSVLVWYTFRIFNPEDELDVDAVDPSQDNADRFIVDRSTIPEFLEAIEEKDVGFLNSVRYLAVKGLDKKIVQLASTYRTQFSRLVREFARELSGLQARLVSDKVNDVQLDRVFAKIRTVIEMTRRITNPNVIDDPKIFVVQKWLLFGSWILLWIPVTIWLSLGDYATIVVYPLLAFALTFDGIADVVIGNPFSQSRQLNMANPDMARMRTMQIAEKALSHLE